jgi:hypothetical protein
LDKHEFVDILVKSLKKNKRIYLASASKTFCDELVSLISTIPKLAKLAYLYYNSEMDTATKESIGNVNESWSKVQLVMTTPSITVGVNYDAKLEFDYTFVYGTRTSVTPRDVIQMMFRVRTLKQDKLVYFINRRNHMESKLKTKHEIEHFLQKKNDFVVNKDKWIMTPDWLKSVVIENLVEEGRKVHDYSLDYKSYLVRCGYKEGTYMSTSKTPYYDMTLEKEVVEYTDIKTICETEMASLKCKLYDGRASKEEKLQLEKFKFDTNHIFKPLDQRDAKLNQIIFNKLWNTSAFRRRFYCLYSECVPFQPTKNTLGRYERIDELDAKRNNLTIFSDNDVNKLKWIDKIKTRLLGRWLDPCNMASVHLDETSVLQEHDVLETCKFLAQHEDDLRNLFELPKDRSKNNDDDKTEKIDLFLLNQILFKWGFAKIRRDKKRKRKRVDGNLVDIAPYVCVMHTPIVIDENTKKELTIVDIMNFIRK